MPRENVIGSNITFEVGRQDGQLILLRKPGLVEPADDGPGKPVNIELHIGRPPILAAGNSNGDIEMLEFADHPGGRFGLAERQFRMPVQPASQCDGMLSSGIDVSRQLLRQFRHLSLLAGNCHATR